MSDLNMKTYKDSFLYKTKLKKFENDENRNNKTIMDFIANSNRIDKTSNAFAGIIEDIKRQQTSRVIFQILMMDKVNLCINTYELPASFKVFDAKDIKNGKNNAIFIDCTGLIEYRNGYFICKKIDVFITYLYDALVYLLYRYAFTKMMNNPEIIISSTSCYVSLFTYILDYLRVTGYKENKNKISYLAGLFYLNHMMGKDVDNYTKNVAAKIADVNLRSIEAYDLYLEPGIFDDINVFILFLAKQFDLKGLDLNVFIGRWMYLFGKGTQYGSELFTSFGVILCNAYCGSYIVGQKQIEKACGSDMIKFNNAIRNLGDATFATTYKENLVYHDKQSVSLAESFLMRDQEPKCAKSAFGSIVESVKLIDAYKDFYKKSNQEKLLPKAVIKVFNTGITVLESYVKDASVPYQEGALCACSKECKKILQGNTEVNKIITLLNDKIILCQEMASNNELAKEDRQRASRCLAELMEMKNNI